MYLIKVIVNNNQSLYIDLVLIYTHTLKYFELTDTKLFHIL